MAPNLAAVSAISGSNDSPEISLTMSAPAFKAASATFFLVVSTEIGIKGRFFLISFIAGIMRSISSDSDILAAPGLVDSAPRSMMSAPFSACSKARATAVSMFPYVLLSLWKESSLRLMILIKRVLVPSIRSLPEGSDTIDVFLEKESIAHLRDFTIPGNPHHDMISSLSARKEICLTVPNIMTSLSCTLQSIAWACTAASPPLESISCLMTFAALASMQERYKALISLLLSKKGRLLTSAPMALREAASSFESLNFIS